MNGHLGATRAFYAPPSLPRPFKAGRGLSSPEDGLWADGDVAVLVALDHVRREAANRHVEVARQCGQHVGLAGIRREMERAQRHLAAHALEADVQHRLGWLDALDWLSHTISSFSFSSFARELRGKTKWT